MESHSEVLAVGPRAGRSPAAFAGWWRGALWGWCQQALWGDSTPTISIVKGSCTMIQWESSQL